MNSRMGINTLYSVGKDIAEFLGLDEPDKYTGHTFRRTSATELSNAGATVMDLKEKFHWNGDKMPLEYVSNSDVNMNKIANISLD